MCAPLNKLQLCTTWVWQAAGAAEGPGPTGKQGAGGITGTNADLRRLNMAASKQILLSLGVGETEINGACLASPGRSCRSGFKLGFRRAGGGRLRWNCLCTAPLWASAQRHTLV